MNRTYAILLDNMSLPETVPPALFMQRYLNTLNNGDRAFHGQLFPTVYPPDVTMHSYLKHNLPFPDDIAQRFNQFGQFIRATCGRGAQLLRLRTLPAELNDNVPAMVAACEMTQNAGEQVRVTLFEPQLERLGLTDVPATFTDALQADVPKAGIWSIRRSHDTDGPQVVATMDYNDDGVLPGLTVYQDIPEDLGAYTEFWHKVFDSDQSVPLQEWRRLY